MKLRKLLILFSSSLLAGASAANTTTATSTVATSTVTLAQIKAVVDDIRTRLGTPTCPASTGCSVAGNIQTLMDRGSMAIIQVESDPDPLRNSLNIAGSLAGFYEVKKYILLGNTIPGLFRDSTGSPRAFGYQYTDTQQHRLPKGRYLIEMLQPAPPTADLACAMSPSITFIKAAGVDIGGRGLSCAPARVVLIGTSRTVLFNGSAIFDFDGVDDEFLVRFKLHSTWFPTGTIPTVGATVKVTKIE